MTVPLNLTAARAHPAAGRARPVPRGARVTLAYVDTSCLVAIAFAEAGAARRAGRLRRFERPLTAEFERMVDAGYLRGADLWHLTNALFLAPERRGLTFLTLDRRQRAVAAQLGFAV